MIDERDDGPDDDEPAPCLIRCSCGVILAVPDGEGDELILDDACDGCAAAYRRWQAEQEARLRAAGILDDDGNPTF